MISPRRMINKQEGGDCVVTSRECRRAQDMSVLFAAMHRRLIKKTFGGKLSLCGKKVLFVGGGVGREIFLLHQRERVFYGVNLDVRLRDLTIFKHCAGEGNLKDEAVAGDGMRLPFLSESFDSVVIYNSLHHMDIVMDAIMEAVRVGKRVYIVDRRKCVLSKVGKLLKVIQPEEGGYYANELDLRQFKSMIEQENKMEIVLIRRHLLYLFFINQAVHDWICRHPFLAQMDKAFVVVFNALFGFLGNGVVIVFERKR